VRRREKGGRKGKKERDAILTKVKEKKERKKSTTCARRLLHTSIDNDHQSRFRRLREKKEKGKKGGEKVVQVSGNQFVNSTQYWDLIQATL